MRGTYAHTPAIQAGVSLIGQSSYLAGMDWLAPALIALAALAAMEGVAWGSHKYVMHGFAWAWHRDHHEPHDRTIEKNDRFALVGAAFSVAMFALGSALVMGQARWWRGTW